MTREEVQQLPVEERIKAFEIVTSLLGDYANSVSHFYDGDSDTIREAEESVARNLKLEIHQIGKEHAQFVLDRYKTFVDYANRVRTMWYEYQQFEAMNKNGESKGLRFNPYKNPFIYDPTEQHTGDDDLPF